MAAAAEAEVEEEVAVVEFRGGSRRTSCPRLMMSAGRGGAKVLDVRRLGGQQPVKRSIKATTLTTTVFASVAIGHMTARAGSQKVILRWRHHGGRLRHERERSHDPRSHCEYAYITGCVIAV